MSSICSKALTLTAGLILALVFILAGSALIVQAQSPCGSTYTVRAGDTLFRIAQRCDTTIQALLNANPNITNRNMIRIGQVIQIPGGTPEPPESNTPGDPQALIVPNSGPAGTEVEVRVSGFPANLEVEIGIGVEDSEFADSFTATTDDQGRLVTTATIPANANVGNFWVVLVRDTAPGGVEATSNRFLVGTGEENVTISPTSGPVGAEINVNASGFPANMTINVGIGRQGSEPVQTLEAQADAEGNVSATITAPDTAEPESNWIVVVGTEGWRITAHSEVFSVTSDPADEPENNYVMHTVQRGEWLHRIARQYNTTVSEILDANPNITNPNLVRVGQQIRIPTADAPGDMAVNIYLIAVGDGGQQGPEIGCADSIVPVPVQIEQTNAPLQAALERLFATDGDEYDLYNVFESADLTVEGINIVNREAIIALSGQLNIGGVCDHPRIEEQLTRTALQFDTIDSVSVSVNGQPLSELLDMR